MAHDIENIVARFWKDVDRKGPDECWNYLGHVHPGGYGIVSNVGRRALRAHRFACFLVGKDIPEDRMACHTCDNKRCCNPAHIYAGTARDNIMDAFSRGLITPVRGRNHSKAKLDPEKVAEIRNNRHIPGIVFARKFGVCNQTISNIRHHKHWRDLGHDEAPSYGSNPSGVPQPGPGSG